MHMPPPTAIKVGTHDAFCVLGAVESEPPGASWAELVDMAEHIDRAGGSHRG